MKNKQTILMVVLTIAVLFLMGDKYIFEKPNQSGQPSVDFKVQVSQALNELLPEKIFDLVWKKTFHYLTTFESLDGFTLVGVPTITGGYIDLTTSNVTNNEIEVDKQPAYQGLITFSERSYFRSNISFSNTTNQTIYLTVGNKDTGNYYGFKVVNDTLYGVSQDGTTEKTILLQTITNTLYNLEARYMPSDKIVFLVDSVEKGTINTNLPTPTLGANVQLMDLRIKTTANEVKTMRASFYEYLQKRSVLL